MQMPGRSYSVANTNYRYGFNGKEKDDKDGVVQYDYGFRIYDPRLMRFKSVDPLTKSFAYYSPYQFAGNMPIAAVDLDGEEVKVAFTTATVSKDHSQVEIVTSISIKIQIVNLSAKPDEDLDLQNIALNLQLDLSNKLGGAKTSSINSPFIFESKDGKVTGLNTTKSNLDNRNYSVTYKTQVYPEISIVDDISKVAKDAWVFGIVDEVYNRTGLDDAGIANSRGKVAIGESQYFTSSKFANEGRQLISHEVFHLLGAIDTYPPHKSLPGTNNTGNVMYYITPDNKRNLTDDQVVQQIMQSVVGGLPDVFVGQYYKQPPKSDNSDTQTQLKNFINENGKASKVDNP